jgi:C4-dicarboxylate transporter, DctQ subunit
MTGVFHRVVRAIERLSIAGGVAAGALLVAIAVLMLTEIVMRSFVGVPLSFSWEYSAYFMATVFFLGAAYALRAGGHVRVTLLYELLPDSLSRILELTATLVGLVVSSYAAVAATGLALESLRRGTTSFTPTATPLFIPQSLVALGLALLAAQFVARLLRLWLREALDPGATTVEATRDQ